ncbi:MAG: acyl-CoA synthetase, partial [Dietzia sp.]|nr:acyl-CoA synthetase [Dietzia sp.]
MNAPVRTIADVAAGPYASVAEAVVALRDVRDRGIFSDGELTPWSQAVGEVAVRIAALREVLGLSSSSSSSASPASASPPHVGLLLAGTPEYLHLLGAAACSEIVVAGLNPTRRGAALARDAALADCALILTDTDHAGLLDGLSIDIPVISVDSPQWADLLARHADAAHPDLSGAPAGPDDLVALVFTS